MRSRKKRALILGILCSLLVFMGVGFAVARTTLNIGGTSTAVNTWDVRMANISVNSKSDGVTNSEEETKIGDDGVSANLQADFIKPGDYITYEVLVENNGTLDATLNELEVDISTDNEVDKELFKVENTLPENKKLSAGEGITFTVTITFNKDAEKLPSGEVRFNVGLNYFQGEGTSGGGDVPGGNEPETDWDFIVNDSGEIIAYNYALGTDVVVPATNYDGKEIKRINEQSFLNKNIEYYQDNSTGQVHSVIYEEEPNFSVVKEKALILFAYQICGSTACIPQIESALTIYGPGEYVFPNGVTESFYISPDPNVDVNSSLRNTEINVATLDLSQATNLTTIGEYAFESAGLTNIDFGDNNNVTTIEQYAFSYNELTSLEIPNSVETIGEHAFYNSQIETLRFGTTERVQNQLSKNNKKALSKLGTNVERLSTSNSKLKTIDNYAFQSNKIVELILPNTVETIGYSAFNSNQISGELVIPENIITIGSYAFGNNLISKVNFGDNSGLNKIESYVFNNNDITELEIPSSITEIGYSAFGNNSISRINFGDNSELNKIDSSAFYNNDITELEIPSSVTEIGSYAFQNNQISELYFPKTVTSLGRDAFSGNTFESLTIEQCNTPICKRENFAGQVKSLIIESGEISSNAFEPYNLSTKIESLTLGEGVTTIGSSAFATNAITTIILPTSLTTIGDAAFENNQISELYFPKTVTDLGRSVFFNNPLETLTIEECNTTLCNDLYNNTFSGKRIFGFQIKTLTVQSGEIGEKAFDATGRDTEIETLILGEGVTKIGNSAFQGNAITSLTFPDTLITIGTYAFADNKISNLLLGNGVTTIEERAFSNNQISELTIPNNVITVGSFAFYGNQIENLSLSSAINSIGDSAFYDNLIKELIIPNGIVEIGYQAFRDNQIGELTISKSVTTIGDYAFYGNQISGELILPTSVVTIGIEAFTSNQISELTIPDSVTTIGDCAFYGNQISELYFPKTVTSLGSSAFGSNPLELLTIEQCNTTICSAGVSNTSKSFGTQIRTLTIESGEIGENAFSASTIGMSDIEILTLGEGVTEIGKQAFSHNAIANLIIPGSVITIGENAFYDSQMKSLTLSEGIKTIGSLAFLFNQISEVTIPSSVTEIGNSAFEGQRDSEYNGTLSSILIKRTEEDFLANVTVGNDWYDNSLNPTITYDPS